MRIILHPSVFILVVPYLPGGGTDIVGRIIAQKFSATLGQQVVVDNRGGATASVGAELVAKSPPDGYMILIGNIKSEIAKWGKVIRAAGIKPE